MMKGGVGSAFVKQLRCKANMIACRDTRKSAQGLTMTPEFLLHTKKC